MEMWDALEVAVETQDWTGAAALGKTFIFEWRAVRDMILPFVGEGADAWVQRFDNVFSGLQASLEAHPVTAEAVEESMARARVFVRLDV